MAAFTSTTVRFSHLLFLLVALLGLVLAAPPSPSPRPTSDATVTHFDLDMPENSALSPVVNTGDIEKVIADAQTNTTDTHVPVVIPAKHETNSQQFKLTTSARTKSLARKVDHLFHDFGLEGHVSSAFSISSALAYIHLLYLTSRSRSYIMEIIQIIAFATFPTLVVVQLANNLVRTLVDVLRNISGGLAYALAALSGQYVFREDEHLSMFEPRKRLYEVPPRQLIRTSKPRLSCSWIVGVAIILLNLACAVLSLALYAGHPTRSDWDTIAIGQDHRLGWTALGGCISASLALLVHACSARWTIHAEYAPEEPVSLLWESDIFTEIALAALLQDVVVAMAGGASLLGLVSVFMANRVVLVVVFIIIVVFNRNLKTFARSLTGPKRRWTAVRPLTIVFSLATCASIIIFQLFTAISEHAAANQWHDAFHDDDDHIVLAAIRML